MESYNHAKPNVRGKAFKAPKVGSISKYQLNDETIDSAVEKAGIVVSLTNKWPEEFDESTGITSYLDVEWRSGVRLKLSYAFHLAGRVESAKRSKAKAVLLRKASTYLLPKVCNSKIEEINKAKYVRKILEEYAERFDEEASPYLKLKPAVQIVSALSEIFSGLGGNPAANFSQKMGEQVLDGPFIRFCKVLVPDLTSRSVKSSLSRLNKLST